MHVSLTGSFWANRRPRLFYGDKISASNITHASLYRRGRLYAQDCTKSQMRLVHVASAAKSKK
jgi:hypothetical protein